MEEEGGDMEREKWRSKNVNEEVANCAGFSVIRILYYFNIWPPAVTQPPFKPSNAFLFSRIPLVSVTVKFFIILASFSVLYVLKLNPKNKSRVASAVIRYYSRQVLLSYRRLISVHRLHYHY